MARFKRAKVTAEHSGPGGPIIPLVKMGDRVLVEGPSERRRPENDLLRRLMAIEVRLAAHALFSPDDYTNSYGIGDGSLTAAQQLQDLRNRIHGERLRLGR